MPRIYSDRFPMKSQIAAIGLAAVTAQAATEKQPSYETQLVAAVLVAEAGGEGWQGLRAVHETICNRAAQKGWSKTRVVTQKFQYSCLNGTTPEKLIAKARKHNVWGAAIKVAQEKPGEIVKGATHYDNVKAFGKPAWAYHARLVATVKNHQFYVLQ